MGDHEFDAGINWWSSIRTSSGFDGNSEVTSTSCTTPQISDVTIIDSSLQNSSFHGMDWNQSVNRSGSGRGEPSFYAMLQEPLNYNHHQQVHNCRNQESNNPTMFQGLFDPQVAKPHQPTFDQNYMNICEIPGNYSGTSSDSLARLPQFFKSSPSYNFQFSNNTAFWNASANDVNYTSSMPVQFSTTQSYEQVPSCTNLTAKSNLETTQKKIGNCSSSSYESSLKKTRIETPSPLPTFKVRKEKLGDRITALQQLVSPFGKTDTASVLHEAIEYIKFLHDQVKVLTTPYLKNGHPMQHQQNSESKQDLKSRGLCVVPIESTYPVASETTADFWTPTFGGTYR